MLSHFSISLISVAIICFSKAGFFSDANKAVSSANSSVFRLVALGRSFIYIKNQRWSPRGRPWPRGQILKSLALASKVKSLALASRPQVLENWPVLGSRTALFFGKLKFCGAVEKFFGKRFFVEIA